MKSLSDIIGWTRDSLSSYFGWPATCRHCRTPLQLEISDIVYSPPARWFCPRCQQQEVEPLLERLKRRRTLFLSVSGTLSAMACGMTTEEDLDVGLFYYNGVGLSSIEVHAKLGQEAELHRLIAAVRKALRQGRAGWALPFESVENNYRGLNQLLLSNGQKSIGIPNAKHYYQKEIFGRVTDMSVIIANELLG